MRRGATLVGGVLILLQSCGGRTDPWVIPGWSGATPTATGGTGIGGNANGVGSGGATGFGSGATGVGGGGTGGMGTGAGGAGVGGSGIGGTAGAGTGAGGSGTGGIGAGGTGNGGTGAGGRGTGGTGTGGAAGTGGGPRDGGTLCFKPLTAAATSLDLYLLLDKSSPMAMVDPPDVAPNTRWARITRAIDTFARKRESPIRLGLGFFPMDVLGSTPSCTAAHYATATVAIGADRVSAISNAMAAESPGNETWTRPALEGALSYAFYWTVNTHAGDPPSLLPPSVVLMTGAMPTGCGGTVDNLAAAAAASFRDTPRIRTHVIAIGADARGLDPVATAGATHRVYASQSLDLDEIFARIARARAVCDIPFDLPNNRPDLSRLEVRARMSSTDPLVAIPRQSDAESCGSGGGWFLEPPTDAKMIMLCPSTCAAVVDTPGQVVAGHVSDMPCVD